MIPNKQIGLFIYFKASPKKDHKNCFNHCVKYDLHVNLKNDVHSKKKCVKWDCIAGKKEINDSFQKIQ